MGLKPDPPTWERLLTPFPPLDGGFSISNTITGPKVASWIGFPGKLGGHEEARKVSFPGIRLLNPFFTFVSSFKAVLILFGSSGIPGGCSRRRVASCLTTVTYGEEYGIANPAL